MRCLNCKQKFEQYQFLNKFCLELECQAKKGLYLLDKKKKQDKKRTYPSKRRQFPDIYSVENKKDLQDCINEIARIIDKDVKCIDCHRTEAKPCWDGGHYKSTGDAPAIRWNLHNIFRQTRHCNYQSEGNKKLFYEGIEQMYGKPYAELVEGLRLRYTPLNLPNADLPGIVKKARKIIRGLKKLDKIYSADDRIELREEINVQLGIYETDEYFN